ncbi:MAG: acyl carrier protein [Actinocatenispora sp.]
MTSTLSRDEIAARLLSFIRDSFLNGDPEGELDENTPLLEYGILNSLNTAMLIAHMSDEFGVVVPLGDVTPATFRTVGSLSAMLYDRGPRS